MKRKCLQSVQVLEGLTENLARRYPIKFLVKLIEKKETDLECPVCLETAAAPIFTCQEMHLICSSCRPRLSSCPTCREVYLGPPKRHRYAEREVEDLKNMQEELSKIIY